MFVVCCLLCVVNCLLVVICFVIARCRCRFLVGGWWLVVGGCLLYLLSFDVTYVLCVVSCVLIVV